MIDYKNTQPGDILQVVEAVDTDSKVKKGSLVRVTEAFIDTVELEDEDGNEAIFSGVEGAEALDTTEYKNEFPDETKERIQREAKAHADKAKVAVKEVAPKKVGARKKK